MSAERYTPEQILSGLRIIWRERLNCKSLFDPDRSFVKQLKEEDRFDDCVLSFALTELERVFGFTCTPKQWQDFLGIRLEWRRATGPLFLEDSSDWEKRVAPRLTFRTLADFIQDQVTPIALEPINLLGRPCLTAGIFRGIEQLATQVDPQVKPFAPSTPIHRCLRGLRLRLFWDRLRWIIEDQLPPPPKIELSERGFFRSLIFKIGVGVAISLWRMDLSGLFLGILTTFALLFPLAVVVGMIEDRLNPLPEEIETFGDLARVLAAILLDQQNEAASCSTP